MSRGPRGLLVLSLLIAISAAAPQAAAAWKPGPERYGVEKHSNVAITMSDGTVLRANVYYPTDPRTGKAAKGPFPVIMVQTPYGKDTVGAASGREGGAEAGSQAGPLPYFVERGYIDVVAEVRGTGDSHGTFDLLSAQQGRDGAELVRWAAKLAHSSGKVGLYGPSYMGLDQFMTANAIGPHSPLKALFPIVAGNDTYRDAAFMGGIADGEFDLAVVFTIFGGLHIVNPAAENPTDLADLVAVENDHIPGLASYSAAQTANILSGGDQAYDEAYWQARAPRNMLARIVKNRIPTFAVDGWFDLYQRGAPLNYSGFQNATRGRSVAAPMTRSQKASGRYQLLQGNWYHLDAGTGADIYRMELAWFERWLKGRRTGIDETTRPFHVQALGSNRWVDSARYPFSEAKQRTFYLAGDRALREAPPSSPAGADQIVFSAATSPCSTGTEQWGFGAGALALETAQLPPDNCTQDDRTVQVGPGALAYTTSPMAKDTMLAGPIDATIYATSTRPEVELVARVEDVYPNGRSQPLTAGALLGSHRALDSGRTWFASDGKPLLPYHPYTRAASRAVQPGAVTRYDIEVYPILAHVPAGHRIRLTLNTSDTPHLLPIPAQAAKLAGGVYRVQRNSAGPSFVELPLASPDSFGRCAGRGDIYRYDSGDSGRTFDCTPPPGCLNSRGGARGKRLGPARLGRTRRSQRRVFRGKRLRARRGIDRYCVSGGGSMRIGYPTARLSRSQRRAARRRAILLLTSSRRYSVAHIRRGARVRTLRRRLHRERRVRVGGNVWYLARGRSATLVFKTRGRRVLDVGLAARRLTRGRAATRRFLRAWELRRR